MNQQCKTQADCFRELARVMDMCEGTKVKWYDAIQCDDSNWWKICAPNFESPNQWSFAIAIVEDKPVFIGDTLYYKDGVSCAVQYVDRDKKIVVKSISYGCCDEHPISLSWNPPTLKEPEIPEGYTRHDGGECPVHPDTVVDLYLAGNDSGIEGATGVKASYATWGDTPFEVNKIIAYKVIKPATVMVELSVEDAEYLASIARDRLAESYVIDRAGIACRKALKEKAK